MLEVASCYQWLIVEYLVVVLVDIEYGQFAGQGSLADGLSAVGGCRGCIFVDSRDGEGCNGYVVVIRDVNLLVISFQA